MQNIGRNPFSSDSSYGTPQRAPKGTSPPIPPAPSGVLVGTASSDKVSGLVDSNFRVDGSKVHVPKLSSEQQKRVDDFLHKPCVISKSVEKKEKVTHYQTEPFTLVELIAFFEARMKEVAPGATLTDAQLVGSIVPYLLGEFPHDIFGDKWPEELTGQYGRLPNDTDLRLYLKGANRAVLEKAVDVLIEFIDSKLKLPEGAPPMDPAQRKGLVKGHFLEKKYITGEKDTKGNLVNEYLTFSIAPQGMNPIDIIVVNEECFARESLWTQDGLRLRVSKTPECSFVVGVQKKEPLDAAKVAQTVVDRSAKVLRIDDFQGLNYFSVLPLLFSGYLKGYRIIESEHDVASSHTLENRLLTGFRAAQEDFMRNLKWEKTPLGSGRM